MRCGSGPDSRGRGTGSAEAPVTPETDSYSRGSMRVLPSKVRLPQVLVLQELPGFVGEHDSPGLENVAAIGDREGHVGVLLDDEDGHARLVHLLDDLESALDEYRR